MEKAEVKWRILILPSLCLILVAFLLNFSVLDTLFYSLFLVSAVTDSFTGEVYEIGLYLLAPVSLVLFYSERSYIAAFFIILIPLYRKSKKLQYYFGEGDLWILLFISMAYGRSVFYSLVYASILGLGYSLLRKKKEVYFVPFLYLGLLLSNIHEINKLFLIY
jgi:hypothetical protein